MKKIFSTNSSLPILTNTDSEDFQPRATNIPIPIVGLALVFKAGEHILQIDGDLFPKFIRKSRQIDGYLFPKSMCKSQHFWTICI